MFRRSPIVHLSLITAVAVAGFFFTSCGGKKEEGGGGESKDFEETKDTIKSEVREDFDQLRVNIPSPGESLKKLSAAKITYNKGFLNSPSKAGSFSSNYQKGIGLGAFGSDLSNAAAYNQPGDAIEYLSQMGKLAGDLGIGAAFDPEVSKKLVQNVAKPDSFQIMLDKVFEKAEKNLRSNQRVAIATLMVAGGWIESLYISVEGLNTNPNGPNTAGIYMDIGAHCQAFDYVFQLLESYKTNADCGKLLQEMTPFKVALHEIGRNAHIGVNDLPKIRETATALRNKIIG